jgi:hypothetical protein
VSKLLPKSDILNSCAEKKDWECEASLTIEKIVDIGVDNERNFCLYLKSLGSISLSTKMNMAFL